MKRFQFSPWLLGLAICGASFAVAPRTVWAERPSAASAQDELRVAIDRMSVNPPQPQVLLEAARQQLEDSVAGLEQFLAHSGDQTRRGWSDRLGLAELKAELAAVEPRASVLRSIEQRYYYNDLGLELPPFVAVRRDLHRWLAAREYASAADPPALLRDRLSELAERTARLAQQPADEDAHRAGVIADWLGQLGLEGAAVARLVRAQHRRVNGMAQVSGRFINSLMEQDVQQRHFINDVILGNLTQGPAITSAHVSFGVVPDRQHAALEVRLRGQTLSPSNVAQRRGVSVYSSATTAIAAQKRVLMSEKGLTLTPATAQCSTQAQIVDVEAGRRLMERIAWRRANQLLPEAEQAAARRAETEAGTSLDQRANAALGGINDVFCQQVRAPLVRFDALPALWQFWTDDVHLRMALVQANDGQLAAATPAPELAPNYDLALFAHESMINNLSEALLAGRTVEDEAWLSLLNLLTGSAPRPLWVHDRAERWSVTFASQRPLVVRFDEERIGIMLHLASAKRGEAQLAEEIDITARFKTIVGKEGPVLVRDGEVAVEFPTAPSATDEQHAAFRSLLLRKFAAVMPAELHFHGLVPPAGGSLGRLRVLGLEEFSGRGGWLTLAYQLAE